MKTKETSLILILVAFLLNSCTEEIEFISISDINHLEKTLSISNIPYFDSISYYTIAPSGLNGKQYGLGSVTFNFDNKELFNVFVQMDYHDDFKEKKIMLSRSDLNWDFQPLSLLQTRIGAISAGAPNILYLGNQHLMFIYSDKNSYEEVNLYWKESFDNGRSWSEPKIINEENTGYYLLNNDRVVYNNGTIWLPVAHVDGDIFKKYDSQSVFCFFSNDFGRTWERTPTISRNYPLMEPAITFLSNGHILMNIRTNKKRMELSKSTDNGKNWTTPKKVHTSADSPQKIINYNNSDTLFMVYNGNIDPGNWERSRATLSLAMSTDEGNNWKDIYTIENINDEFNYTYPSMVQVDNKLFITYYKKENAVQTNSSLKGVIIY